VIRLASRVRTKEPHLLDAATLRSPSLQQRAMLAAVNSLRNDET